MSMHMYAHMSMHMYLHLSIHMSIHMSTSISTQASSTCQPSFGHEYAPGSRSIHSFLHLAISEFFGIQRQLQVLLLLPHPCWHRCRQRWPPMVGLAGVVVVIVVVLNPVVAGGDHGHCRRRCCCGPCHHGRSRC